MKKARIDLIDTDPLTDKPVSTHILVLPDSATDDDLLDEIGTLEEKTQRVCNDWAWFDNSTTSTPGSLYKELNHRKLEYATCKTSTECISNE